MATKKHGWLGPAMGITLVVVLASGSKAGKFGDREPEPEPPKPPAKPPKKP